MKPKEKNKDFYGTTYRSKLVEATIINTRIENFIFNSMLDQAAMSAFTVFDPKQLNEKE